MADLFRCDKCGGLGPKSSKAGRLIIQELGHADQMPHPALYNRKAEVCAICFCELRGSMDRHMPPRPSFEEASDITKEANASLAIITENAHGESNPI